MMAQFSIASFMSAMGIGLIIDRLPEWVFSLLVLPKSCTRESHVCQVPVMNGRSVNNVCHLRNVVDISERITDRFCLVGENHRKHKAQWDHGGQPYMAHG